VFLPKTYLHLGQGGRDGIETLVRWDLDGTDGVTTVRLTHSGFASESLRTRNDGWPLILDLLHNYLDLQ
jgi:hypothetical protein